MKNLAWCGLVGRVAGKYDLMNDLMSFGLHRFWKRQFIRNPKHPQMKLLDVAGGTGDIALRFMETHRDLNPSVTVFDMTPEMLEAGKAKAYDATS